MPLRTSKGGGGAALLGALGLGGFARLDLPAAPPDGLDLTAAVDLASGRITVSLGGACVSASPADLAAALALPLGPVALAPEVDAAVFSSAQAIAAVRGFVNDRVLLGIGGDVGEVPEEVATALRLVEEGKAHAVDWGRLVWAMLEREVVTGEPRRYAPHLLHLMECQRPELFAEVDGRLLPLGKRRKGLMLQQCQMTDEQLVDCSEIEVEEESLLCGNISNDQCQVAEAEVGLGLVSGVSRNIGESLIRGDSHNDQCRAAEAEVEGLVSGISQNIGDLEAMPVFGKDKEVTGVISVDYKRTIVEEGEGIHGMSKGNSELGSQKCSPSDVKVLGYEMGGNGRKGAGGWNANYQSSTDDSSFLSLLRTMDEQDDSSSLQKVIFRTKCQPGSNQHVIEIEDEEADNNDNGGVGPSPPVIRNGPFNFIADQSPPHFDGCVKQILASVPNMKDAVLDKEKAFMDTQAAVQRMTEMLMEKDYIIASTKKDILEELQARHATICRLEQDMKAMVCTVQQYEKLFQKSFAAFLEYRNRRLCAEGGESTSEVIGMADGQNHICWMQQLRIHQMINGLQKHWLAKYTECIEQITGMATRMTDLNNKVKRLKVPDLNNGSPQL